MLRLLHPFMPFVTEEAWQHLPHTGDSLMVAAWPEAGERDSLAEARMQTLMDIVRGIRALRADFRIEAARWVEVTVTGGSNTQQLINHRAIIEALARSRPLHIIEHLANNPAKSLHTVAAGCEIFVPIADLVNLEAELSKVDKEVVSLEMQGEQVKARLADTRFIIKAPAAVVEREQAKVHEIEDRLTKLRNRQAMLRSI
jgi:valyl-tRNA synthetase